MQASQSHPLKTLTVQRYSADRAPGTRGEYCGLLNHLAHAETVVASSREIPRVYSLDWSVSHDLGACRTGNHGMQSWKTLGTGSDFAACLSECGQDVA